MMMWQKSIDNFWIDRLLEEEVKYTELDRQELLQNLYFLGFFLFMARKLASNPA